MRMFPGRFWIACLLIAALAASHAHAQYDAVTRPKHDIDMAFEIPGRVWASPVKVGDVVKKGDLLLQLDDRAGQARIARLQKEVDNDIAVLAQEAELELATVNLDRVKEMHGKNVASFLELRQAEATHKVADLKLQQAQLNQELKGHDLAETQAQHEKSALKAPFDGVVQRPQRGKEVSEGETVQQQQPVLRLVMVTTLVVDANVPIGQALRIKEGDKAWVRSALPDHDAPVEGRIVHVAIAAESASGTKLVRIEVPNESNYLEAGWQVKVYLTPPSQAPVAAARERLIDSRDTTTAENR